MLKGRPLMNLFDLNTQEFGYREIARVTGHSRNTVRKYLRDGGNAIAEAPKLPRISKLDPHKVEINRLVSDGLLSVPAIMSRIVPLGYEGKESILRTYVSSIRPPAKPRQSAVRRYETQPGKQSQFDWGGISHQSHLALIARRAVTGGVIRHCSKYNEVSPITQFSL